MYNIYKKETLDTKHELYGKTYYLIKMLNPFLGMSNGISVIAVNTTTQNFALVCDETCNDVLSGCYAENYIKSMNWREITNECFARPLLYCTEKVVTRTGMAVLIIRTLG